MLSFEKDDDGCEKCRCRDPCHGVQCPQWHVCRLVKKRCLNEHNCDPIPKCMTFILCLLNIVQWFIWSFEFISIIFNHTKSVCAWEPDCLWVFMQIYASILPTKKSSSLSGCWSQCELLRLYRFECHFISSHSPHKLEINFQRWVRIWNLCKILE